MRQFIILSILIPLGLLPACEASLGGDDEAAEGLGDDARDDETSPPRQGRVRVLLRDAPTDDLDELWLTIDEVSAHHMDLGWLEVSEVDQTVDLLALQDGVFAELGLAALPEGDYDQVRLLLADAWVVVDGVEQPLDVPSGFTSGVKVKADFAIADCGDVILDLDWDAGAQLQLNPQGYKLRPTIEVQADFDDSGCLGCSGPVIFPDPALEASVLSQTGAGASIDAMDAELITYLNISSAGVTDLRGLECFTGLQSLIGDHNDISDITPLTHLDQLRQLRLVGSDIHDISALANKPDLDLLWLQWNGTGVTDISPLADSLAMRDLRVSSFSGGTVSDISVLAGMSELAVFQAANHQISDLSPLAASGQLRELVLAGNDIHDISALANKPDLDLLWLQWNGTGVTDISPLADSLAMRDLRLDASNGGGLSDISVISNMGGLQGLSLRNHQIIDTSPLSAMCQLSFVYLNGNPLACPDATLTALLNCNVTIYGGCP